MRVAILLCLIVCVGLAVAKHHKKKGCTKIHRGCSVLAGQCVCKREQACENPFPYRNEHQCFKDLRGEFNKCKKSPCHNGECFQVKMNGRQKPWCSCAASGFYGEKCEHECPPMEEYPLPTDFPTDCIY